MKRAMRLLTQLALMNTLVLPTVACGRWVGGGSLDPGHPAEPEEKTIDYYLDLIREDYLNIMDCRQWIRDIEQEIAGGLTGEDKKEAEIELDFVQGEIHLYLAEINEYQYQILVLQTDDNKITKYEKKEAIGYLITKVDNLQQDYQLKDQHKNELSDEDKADLLEDLANIKKMIDDTNVILAKIKGIED